MLFNSWNVMFVVLRPYEILGNHIVSNAADASSLVRCVLQIVLSQALGFCWILWRCVEVSLFGVLYWQRVQ